MTSTPPADIQSLIEAHINGFNNQNTDMFLSVFGDTAIIIDGFAPYRWLNPNAPTNWLADVEKWREDLGVTSENLTYEMGFWNVEASSAYAVISGTLSDDQGPVGRSHGHACIHVRKARGRLEDRGAGVGADVVAWVDSLGRLLDAGQLQ